MEGNDRARLAITLQMNRAVGVQIRDYGLDET